MNRFLLSVCLLAAALVALVAATPCVADTTNGVIAEERVVNLPQDQGKWYISVVGEATDARFREVLGWFDSNKHLLNLKNSVHFNVVTTDQPIYTERYVPNTPVLPMIRLQDSKGVVYSQIAGTKLPMTAEALSSQIAADVKAGPDKAACPLRRLRRPTPTPTPILPVVPDLLPGPLEPADQPVLEEEAALPDWLLWVFCAAGFALGASGFALWTFKHRKSAG